MNTEILGVILQWVCLVVLCYPLGRHIAKVYKGEKNIMDFMAPVAKGAADFFNSNAYAQVLAECKFVAPKSYLWPLPTTTMQVMKNIKENNPGY